jgi:hypothetical protein
MDASERLLTTGTIADELKESLHRVAYVIRSRKIPHESKAGNLRVFSRASVETIAAVLSNITAARRPSI